MELMSLLAYATLGIAIAFALWSKSRTDKELRQHGTEKSSLARTSPDPDFLPDARVTDPHNVTALWSSSPR